MLKTASLKSLNGMIKGLLAVCVFWNEKNEMLNAESEKITDVKNNLQKLARHEGHNGIPLAA